MERILRQMLKLRVCHPCYATDHSVDSPVPYNLPGRLLGHSSHAQPPSSAVIRQLLMLELKFAALRDRLYVERMEEAAREEEMVLSGKLTDILRDAELSCIRHSPGLDISIQYSVRAKGKITRSRVPAA
jgi:hypothetical protein